MGKRIGKASGNSIMGTQTFPSSAVNRAPRSRRSVAIAMVAAQLFALAGVLTLSSAPASAGPPAVMFGYVPMPADEFQLVMENVNTDADTTVRLTVGITNAGNGAVMYYDHWEDGFEADIANPVQATTETWGDGNAANGNAADHCTSCAGDLLTPGDVIIMRNDIPTPGHTINGCTANAPVPPAPLNTRCYDGRDKVASTRGFALTAGGFSVPLNSVLAGAVSAYDTSKYGTSYIAPVGEDTPTPAGVGLGTFETSSLIIMASEDGTAVSVDADNDGSFEFTDTINEGEVSFVNGGVLEGARVVTSGPVQVFEGTGDVNSGYESRWFTLFPTPLLSDDYLNPVGSSDDNQRTTTFIYNPTAASITVTPTCTSCTVADVLTIPAESGATFGSPLGEGTSFASSGGERFVAVGTSGAHSGAAPGSGGANSARFDWGFSLVPTSLLTTQVVLGFAPGDSAIPPTNDDYNPVWVTSLTASTIRVDFDGDPSTGAIGTADCFGARHDLDIAVGALESTRITDPNDNDMSGARVYTCDGTPISGAWGEDPDVANQGAPGFDAGYAIIPTTTMIVNKTAGISIDANGDGRFGPGDEIEYQIDIADAGSLAFTNVVAQDTIPAGTTYVPASTTFDDGVVVPISDDVVPPAASVFPLDESGAPLPDISAGQTVSIRFRVTVDNPILAAGTLLTNIACSTAAEANACDTIVTQMVTADLELTKTLTTTPIFAGDNAVFRVSLTNQGPDTATGVEVTDLLPAGTVFVSSTPSQGAYNSGTGLWTVGTLTTGQTVTLDITATINALSVENFAQVTAAQAADPDSNPAEDPLGPSNPPNQDDEDSVPVTVLPRADVSLTKTLTAGPLANGNTTFQITATNAGPASATGVAVTDIPPAGSSFVSATASQGTFASGTNIWTIGTLTSGQSVTLDVTYDITTFPSVNFAQVTAMVESDPDSQPAENPLGPVNPPDQDDEASAAIPAFADLSLNKTVTANPTFVGENVVYDVVVDNAGPAGATNVTVADLLPTGLVFVTDTPSQGTYDAGTGIWSIGSIAAGGSATLSITARVTAAGTINNYAQIQSSDQTDPDSAPGDNSINQDDDDTEPITTTASTIGDFVWFDVDGDGIQDAGEPGLAGVDVDVTWLGPDGVVGGGDDQVFPTVTTDPLGGWSLTGLPVGVYVTTVDPTTLANGITVPTADPDGVGTPNGATFTVTGPGRTDIDFGYLGSSTVGDTIFNDLDLSGTAGPGEGLDGVNVTMIWAGFNGIFGDADDLTDTSVTAGGGIYTFTGIAAGNYRITVDTTTIPAGLSNTIDPDGGNNSTADTALTVGETDLTQDFGYLALAIDLNITKDDGGASTTPGGVVSYTLNYGNTGNTAATGVVISETVPANATFNAGGSTAGWSCADGAPAATVCTLAVGTVAASGTGTATYAINVVNPLPAGVTQITNTASTTDDGTNGPDPTPGDNTDTDFTPVTAAPDLQLTKDDGGASTTPGGTVSYTLTVTNVGNQNATGVTITDTVPANTTFNAGASTAGWTCVPNNNPGSVCTFTVGNLSGGGASTAVTFAVTVANPLPGGVTEIANSAITADDGTNGPDPTPGDNDDDDTTPVVTALDLGIVKTDGGATTTPGGTVTYALNYTNAGNVGATGVVLTDTVPANATFNAGASTAGWVCVPDGNAGSVCTLAIGALAAGGNGSANFAVTVANPLPAGVTQISNTATVGDDGTNGPDSNPNNNTSTDTTPVDAAPDLAITKDDGSATTTPGGTVSYTLTVTNNGNQNATGVTITDTVPANTTFNAGASTAGWVCAPNNNPGSVCTFTVGNLNVGASANATYAINVVNPLPAGVTQITNTASTSDDGTNGPDPTPGDNTDDDFTPVTAAPDLQLTKDDGGASTTPGGTVSYTLTVTNVGNQNATGVTITDTVPANTTFNAGASTAGWTCVPNNNPGSVCTFNVGNLSGGGASTAVTFAVTVANPLPGGVTEIANAAITADDGTNGPDPTPGDNDDDDTTPVVTALDLGIVKTDGGATTTPGGTVTYALNYTNAGNVGATGVVLTDTVPANATFNAGASTAGWVCVPDGNAGSVCTLAIGALAAGGNGSANFAVTVANPLPAGVTQISNTASVGDDGTNGPDGNPNNNTSTDTTPVDAAPDLAITKDDGGATVLPGNVVVYTLSYVNNGDQNATNVGVSEVVPAGTTFVAASSTAGWSCADGAGAGVSCGFTIGNLAAGANGSVTFAVRVIPAIPSPTVVNNSVTIFDDGQNGPDPTPGDNTDEDTTPITLSTIGDQIFDDNDGSGTFNGGDNGLSGVDVNFRWAGPNGTFNDSDDATGTATTNGSGIYLIPNLPPGEYRLTIDTADLPAGVVPTADPDGGADSASQLTLAGGNDNLLQDFGYISTVVDLNVTKSDGGASTTPGGTVTYQISYGNALSSTVPATGVALTETVPANSSFNAAGSDPGWVCAPNGNAGSTCTRGLGTIVPGGSGVVQFSVIVANPVPAGVTQLSNTVTIADDGDNGPDPTPGDNTSTDTTPITAAPDLQLTKDDGGASAVPGGTVAYTLTVTNVGNQNATGVTITDTVPANTTFNAGASTAGWVCAPNSNPGSVCTFTVGNLSGGGASTAVTFAVTVANPLPGGVTEIANSAITADDGTNGPDPTPDDNDDDDTTPVVTALDLGIVKTDGGATTTPGGTVTYALNYTNAGNVGATGVVLTDTVPANATFNAGASTAGWVCVPDGNAGSVCTLAIGALAAGGNGSANFAVTVANPLPAGVTQISNTASVGDDGANGPDANPNNNTSTDTTPVTAAPDLSIIKDDGGATTTPGGTVAYTLTVSNNGNQNATGVTITDTVPANTTFNTGASTAGWVCAPNINAGSVCTFTIGNLNATAFVNTVIALDVVSPLPAGVTQITNTATVADDGTNGPDPTPGDNTDTDTTPVTAAPDLSVTKDDGGVQVALNGLVTYTLNYANVGTVGASNVVVTETVPANTAFVATGSAAWSCADGATPGTVCTINVGTVEVGGTGSLAFVVRVFPSGAFTQVVNNTSIADDGTNGPDEDPSNNADTDETPVIRSVIGDTVFLDLDGDGVQDVGDVGVAGVTVTLLFDADLNGSTETTIATTTTDASGNYTFIDLAPGLYRAVVTVPAGFGSSTPTFVDDDLTANESFLDADFGLLGATIGDQVWRDVIPNGVYESGSEPGLSGVTVELLNGVGTVVATTVTDANGNYEFRGLAAGDYEIRFVPLGFTVFALPNVGADDSVDSDAGVLTGRTGVFALGVAEVNNSVDAGMYIPTDISGVAYEDLNNDGTIDAGENGIAGVTVTLTGTDDLGNVVNTVVVTNAGGVYTFPGVRAGTYTITETQPAPYLDGTDEVGTQGGTLGNDVISNIVIGEGDPASGYNFGELPPGGLTGVVFDDTDGDGTQDAGEVGIVGVTVTLTGTNDVGPIGIGGVTNGSGAFSFPNLRPGTYIITETQPAGFLDGLDTAGTLGGTAANDVISVIVVPVGGNGTNYTFAEIRPGSIGDRVWDDADNDGVQDAGETGLNGVTVTLTGTDVLGNVINTSVVTAGDGNYAFTNLLPGTYSVDVNGTTVPAGYTPSTVEPRPVVLTAGQQIDDVDFGYRPPDPPSGVIGDRVWSDTDGDGVQDVGEGGLGGVLVTLFQDTDANGSYETTVTSQITAGAGSYSFPGLPAGAYRVVITAPSGQDPTTPTSIDVALADRQVRDDVDFGLRPPPPPLPGTIGDRVWNDIDGDGTQEAGEAGVNGVTVTLRQDTNGDGIYETEAATQITSGDGNYSFGNLPPGQYQVVATVPAGQNATSPTAIAVNLGSGDSVDTVDFGIRATPAPTGTIGDRVWNDTDGDGVQDVGETGNNGVTVTLREDTNGDGTFETTVTSQVTAGDGNYSFPNLAPGNYSVTVTTPVGLSPTTPAVVTVALSGGEVIDTVDFGLSATPPTPGSIGDRVWSDNDRDEVQDPDEPGMNGITVTLLEDTDGDGTYEATVATTVTAGNGNYVFGAVPPGRYLVVVTPPVGQSPTTPGTFAIVLDAGEIITDADFGLATPPEIPFDLQLDKSLEGTVTAGGVATWRIAIRNNGIVGTPNPITVTDVLPTGLTFQGFTGTGWTCTVAGQTVTCTLPQSLAVGASNEVMIQTTISAAAGTVIANNATVAANGVEITLTNNSDTAQVTVQAPPTTAPPTTATPTTTTAAPTPTTAPPSSNLPVTGGESTRLFLWGMLLMGLGSLVLIARRRVAFSESTRK